jgi:hypothetical protein
MPSELHYLSIRKNEGREAELRARAADRGEEYSEPSQKSDFERWLEVLALVGDAAAATKRLTELRSAEASAKAAQRESDKYVDQNRAAIAKEREAHDAAIAKEREKCTAQCAHEMEEVRAHRAQAETLRSQAKADADASAKLKADLEARVALIKQAGL